MHQERSVLGSIPLLHRYFFFFGGETKKRTNNEERNEIGVSLSDSKE